VKLVVWPSEQTYYLEFFRLAANPPIDIFDIHMREMDVDNDAGTGELATVVGSITGAEIWAVCTEAG